MGLSPSIQAPPKPEILETKKWDTSEIRYWKITSNEILEGEKEGTLIPGAKIPVILVRGDKLNVEGRTYIKGLIHDARDAQRLLNYWETSAAEHIALMPKAPWVATAKQLKGFEKFYAQANEENYPYLVYNVDPDAQNAKPTREGVGNPPMALFSQAERAEKYFKSAVGMFGADTGDMDQMSGRASGTAIEGRQKPSENSTFLYQDNMNKATLYTGRIIEGMIPIIYDTERDVRLRSIDGTSSFMPINTTLREAIDRVKHDPTRYTELDLPGMTQEFYKKGGSAEFNSMSRGKYETIMKIGPDFATQKAESANMLIKLTQSNPKAMGLMLDLIVKNMDFIDSDEAVERLEKMLPQGMVKPKRGKPAPTPPPPPPQVNLAQKKVEVELAKVDIQKAKLQVEKLKAIKEMQGEKGEIRKMLISLLAEVYAPEAPQGGMQQ
jgi:hypothetical protein